MSGDEKGVVQIMSRFSRRLKLISAVQTITKLIRPKGRVMKRLSSGLHKDVPTIFDGVWNPATDNYQQSFEPPASNDVAPVGAQPQFIDDRHRENKLGGFFRACKEVPGFVFRSRSRRERKRLLAISKHLMINMES
jgi:hypothetical protein